MDSHRRPALSAVYNHVFRLRTFASSSSTFALVFASAWFLSSCRSGSPTGIERTEEPIELVEIPQTSPTEAYAPEGSRGAHLSAVRIVAANSSDDAYASNDPIEARRVVYRVTFKVPPGFGSPSSMLPQPAAELYIDVSDARLRARFVGPGWPVPPGSEVRMRRDVGGTYVFDSGGGRPLGPGQLASWFEGGPLDRWLPSVRIRPPPSNEQIGPGSLICTLLAEWSSQSLDELVHRCGNGGSPPSFRLGPWRAERTADVAVELPRSSLRADHEGAPRGIAQEQVRAFLAPSALAHFEPEHTSKANDPTKQATETGLRILNEAETRSVVSVQGVAIGSLEPGGTAVFEGLPRGIYRVAAMRPLGTLAWTPHLVAVPGQARF